MTTDENAQWQKATRKMFEKDIHHTSFKQRFLLSHFILLLLKCDETLVQISKKNNKIFCRDISSIECVHPCSLFEAGYMPFMHQEIALGISEHSAGYKLGHFAPLMHQDKLRLENQNIN